MRVLTAGFDRDETERIGDLLIAAGHAVLSASGAGSCRTLANSVKPNAVLVPEGSAGDDALTWAPDLLGDARVARVAAGADPLAAIESPPRAVSVGPDDATANVAEEAIVAAIEAATLPALAPPTPRRAATLRSTSMGPALADKLGEVRFGDYHAVLEVQPGASTYVIRQQYDSLRDLYTPAGWHAPVGPTDIASLQEIGHGLDDAFAVLGHPPYNARYEAALAASAPTRQ